MLISYTKLVFNVIFLPGLMLLSEYAIRDSLYLYFADVIQHDQRD